MAAKSKGETEAGRHLESRKRYILDLMVWSTQAQCDQVLAERYCFSDARAVRSSGMRTECVLDASRLPRDEKAEVEEGEEVETMLIEATIPAIAPVPPSKPEPLSFTATPLQSGPGCCCCRCCRCCCCC